jgi:hypothetical protein
VWSLSDLDDRTRELMIVEIELDRRANRLYSSNQLSEEGQRVYPNLLVAAAQNGTPDTLAAALAPVPGRLWLARYVRRNGSFAAVARNAPERLAGGEFNRFYMRGVCRRSIEIKRELVEVFRANSVLVPRAGTRVSPGDLLDAERLLLDLRNNVGTDTETGMPRGPGSGLSVRMCSHWLGKGLEMSGKKTVHVKPYRRSKPSERPKQSPKPGPKTVPVRRHDRSKPRT